MKHPRVFGDQRARGFVVQIVCFQFLPIFVGWFQVIPGQFQIIAIERRRVGMQQETARTVGQIQPHFRNVLLFNGGEHRTEVCIDHDPSIAGPVALKHSRHGPQVRHVGLGDDPEVAIQINLRKVGFIGTQIPAVPDVIAIPFGLQLFVRGDADVLSITIQAHHLARLAGLHNQPDLGIGWLALHEGMEILLNALPSIPDRGACGIDLRMPGAIDLRDVTLNGRRARGGIGRKLANPRIGRKIPGITGDIRHIGLKPQCREIGFVLQRLLPLLGVGGLAVAPGHPCEHHHGSRDYESDKQDDP